MTTSAPVVVLLGGASGVGKTQLSYRLARHLGAALVEVDDLVVAIQAVTDPDSHPDIHRWVQHVGEPMSTAETVDGQIRFARAMQPALLAVIDNHLETGTPVVIEGDYIVPGIASPPEVRTVLVHEDDVTQLVANYVTREPDAGEQRERAVASLEYGRWLVARANEASAPVVAARPWDTAFERLLAAVSL